MSCLHLHYDRSHLLALLALAEVPSYCCTSLVCVGGAIPVASLRGSHVLAQWSQLPLCVACVCISNAVAITFSHDLNIQHYNQRHLHVLLVCVGSAIPVTFSYGWCAPALQLQSPPCTTSILAVQPDSPFHVARACGQCCARYHHAMLACDSPGACLAAARNDVSDGMSQLLHWLDLLCSRCLKSSRSWHVRQ